MSEHQTTLAGRARKRIKKDEAEKARVKIKGAFRPGQSLKNLELDELVVLLADVSAEILSRGGSDVLPRGMQHRLRRAVEE